MFFRKKKHLTRDSKSRSIAGSVSVGNHKIENLVPLGSTARPGITKAGQLSLKGWCNGCPVKVYSVFSETQLELRKQVQQINFDGCKFADIVTAENGLVVEKWVEGVPVSGLNTASRRLAISAVNEFLLSLHSERSASLLHCKYQSAFCYLHDYLVSRLSLWSHHDQVKLFLRSWEEEFARLKKNIPFRLSHPDLSMDNLIYNKLTNDFVIIDNELLAFGRGWILDWHNSLLNKMGCIRPSLPPDILPSFVDQTWQLRRLGSALDAGDFVRAQKILDL